MNFINFDTTIRDILAINNLPEGDYIRIARILNRSLKSLNLFTLPGRIKTYKAKVKDNFTVDLDPSVTEVYKVGTPTTSGERIRIMKNRKIWRESDMEGCSCGANQPDVQSEEYSCISCIFHGYYTNGLYGEIFGAYTKSFPGSWDYDEDNDRLKIEGLNKDDLIYIEAKVTGDVNMIPEDAFLVVQAKVMELYHSNDPRLKEHWHNTLGRETRVLKRHKLSRSIEEFYAMLRGTVKLAKY